MIACETVEEQKEQIHEILADNNYYVLKRVRCNTSYIRTKA